MHERRPDVVKPQYAAASCRFSQEDAGARYDMFFPPLPADDTPSVLVESSAHVTWRTVTMPAALADLDAIGQLADGEAATVIGSDLKAAEAAIRVRPAKAIQKKATMNVVGVALAELALGRSNGGGEPLLPAEPSFYVAGYTAVLPYDRNGKAYGQRGPAEVAMVAAIAEAEAVLGLQAVVAAIAEVEAVAARFLAGCHARIAMLYSGLTSGCDRLTRSQLMRVGPRRRHDEKEAHQVGRAAMLSARLL